MPQYQFVCDDCGRHFDVIIKWEEIDAQKCISCGGDNIWKAVSAHGDYQINGPNGASTRPRKNK